MRIHSNGRLCEKVCAGVEIADGVVGQLVQGPELVLEKAPSLLFGDPCPMIYKQLDVWYECLSPAGLKDRLLNRKTTMRAAVATARPA